MKPIYAEARGNTFLIFDCLDGSPPDWDKALTLLLKTNRDDALILLPSGALPHLKMVVLGQDGAFGEFCGNGSRAVATYLCTQYPDHTQFFLGGNCLIDQSQTTLPLTGELSPFTFEGRTFIYGEALEPHLTLEEDLSDDELFALSRKLQPLFPGGINVNAWTCLGANKIFVKTYERGVQRLTQSCGTGSAISVISYLNGEGLVEVLTPGGTLHISVTNNHLHLIGPAIVEFHHA